MIISNYMNNFMDRQSSGWQVAESVQVCLFIPGASSFFDCLFQNFNVGHPGL